MLFSVNHVSESKISAHFPQWFSEQLDNTGFILWSNNNWSTVADCSGTVSAALYLALPTIFFMFNGEANSVVLTKAMTETRSSMNPELSHNCVGTAFHIIICYLAHLLLKYVFLSSWYLKRSFLIWLRQIRLAFDLRGVVVHFYCSGRGLTTLVTGPANGTAVGRYLLLHNNTRHNIMNISSILFSLGEGALVVFSCIKLWKWVTINGSGSHTQQQDSWVA